MRNNIAQMRDSSQIRPSVPRAATTGPAKAMSTVYGLVKAQILITLTELQVPDILGDQHRSATDLAAQLGLNKERLEHVLHAAVSSGILAEAGKKEGAVLYRNNAISSALQQKHPNSIHNLVQSVGMGIMGWMPGLTEGLKAAADERAIYEVVNGTSFYQMLQKDAQKDQTFNRGMAEVDAVVNQALVLGHDWAQYKRVVDVGGGYGGFMKTLLKHYSKLDGVLFDQPHVIDKAQAVWKRSDMSDRVQLSAGSFFDAETGIPAGQAGDAYVLRDILHGHDDAHAITILKGCRAAMGASAAKLILIEMGLEPGTVADDVSGNRLFDVHMMALENGKLRSKMEYEKLFSLASFELCAMKLTRSPFSILEFVPVQSRL